MKVAVGGTFDPLHDGHEQLLGRALELGDDGVTIGLTSDELAPQTRDEARDIRSYDERREALRDFVEAVDEWGRDVAIRKLDDPYGVASEDPAFDALVVSPETAPGGDRINELREERGYDPLEIEVVPHVMADDGEPISSTRIVRGEIDAHGHVVEE